MPYHQVLLQPSGCGLLIIDIQEKLFNVVSSRDQLLKNVSVLIRGFQTLNIPAFITEQYPKGLGPTIPNIRNQCKNAEVFEKLSFSCCTVEKLLQSFRNRKIKQIVLCGIETHICVWQTAMDLKALNFSVTVVSDAVSSRSQINRHTALERMRQHDIEVSTVETVLFELLEKAGTEAFKTISALVK